MNSLSRELWIPKLVAITLLFGAGCASGTDPKTQARDATDARNLVEQARIATESMTMDSKMGPDIRGLLAKAKGVFIAPDVLRGAFIFGGSGGSGVFMVRTADGKSWSGPTFHTLGGISWGLQIGGDSSEVMLLAMTDRGVNAFLSNNVKLGVGASIAAGPVGGGAAAGTANISADILSFSRSQGAYAGLSLDGAVIATREALNEAYYGRKVSTSDVLLRGAAHSQDSAGLIVTLNKAVAMR